ncbi:MAG: flagellar basal body-associated FliL family protein [Synergistetes bacterium]|nr:flagellar basal body-associated FliL family protein [Synergistota bacterium]MDW8193039.1 flagellar basal body-associated FliL family protein [Synergistota bacterium]
MKFNLKLPIDIKTIVIVFLAVIISAGVSFFVAQRLIMSKLNAGRETRVVESGPIMDLGEFTINLADKDEVRYARFKISLEVNSSKAVAELSKSDWNVRLRDTIIITVRDKKASDLSTSAGLLSLASEIRTNLNKIVPPDKAKILRVYFTEFVVQ